MTRLVQIRVWVAIALFSAVAQAAVLPGDIRCLQRACEEFLARYDKEEVRRDYPEAIKGLSSNSREEQLRGVQVLGATRELYVLPWLVPLIDAGDPEVRVMAGSSIEQIVSSMLLKRRDPSQPGIVIRPPKTGEVDLQPLSWLALRMIRSGEPNLASYGATMAAYLGRLDFEDDLRLLLQSPHRAVLNSASQALVVLGFEQQQLKGLPPCPALERTAESGWVFLTRPSDGIVLSAPPSFYSFDLHDGAVWKSGDAVLEFTHQWRSLYSFPSHENACRTTFDGLPTIYIESQSAADVELTAWFVTPDHFGPVLSARSARPEDLSMLRSIVGAVKKPVPKPNPLPEVETLADCVASIDFAKFTGPRRVVSFPEQRSLCEHDFAEGCTTYVIGELTDAAVHELFQHVMKLDEMPVLSIVGTSDEVQVETGLISRCAPLGGRGKEYTFKRCSGGWKLIRANGWVS